MIEIIKTEEDAEKFMKFVGDVNQQDIVREYLSMIVFLRRFDDIYDPLNNKTLFVGLEFRSVSLLNSCSKYLDYLISKKENKNVHD